MPNEAVDTKPKNMEEMWNTNLENCYNFEELYAFQFTTYALT